MKICKTQAHTQTLCNERGKYRKTIPNFKYKQIIASSTYRMLY